MIISKKNLACGELVEEEERFNEETETLVRMEENHW